MVQVCSFYHQGGREGNRVGPCHGLQYCLLHKKIVEKAGIKRFIMKPVTIASLSEQIQQLLEGNPPITQGLTRGK